MQGMRRSVKAIIETDDADVNGIKPFNVTREQKSLTNQNENTSYYDKEGCYVVTNANSKCYASEGNAISSSSFYAIVDGNRVPDELHCQAEFMIKGDGSEYCIAAASIIAKVTRDRIMNSYSDLFPEYNLSQHKGYPTKAHKELITKHGAINIHRKSFAPLKYMSFDKDGKILKNDC